MDESRHKEVLYFEMPVFVLIQCYHRAFRARAFHVWNRVACA